MLKRLHIILLLLICNLAYSQSLSTTNKKAQSLFEKARTEYISENYDAAIELAKSACSKDNNFIEAYILLSDIYNKQDKYELEKEAILQSINIDSTFFAYTYLNLGKVDFNLGNYDSAEYYIQKFINQSKSSELRRKGVKELEYIRFVRKQRENPLPVVLKNMGPNVNSKLDEYWPSLTADGSEIIYTVLVPRDNEGESSNMDIKVTANSTNYQEDFYVSKLDKDDEWSPRNPLSQVINTDRNEGAQTLSADGNLMFFTACGRRDSRGSCDIYYSRRTKDGWTEAKNVGHPINTTSWESQPTFSANGRTLYFVSNRPGGIGGRDIWYSELTGTREDGSPIFGKVQNVGPNVNSKKDENSPFIHSDNKTIYFASDGWLGFGKMDLYKSSVEKTDTLVEPLNLGYPINTPEDEIGLVVSSDGRKAYFASDKKDDSYGGQDIFYFDMPQKIRPNSVSYVHGKVFDMDTKQKLNATFELRNLETGDITVQASSTSFSGEFLICIPSGAEYALNVLRKGYLFYSENFNMLSANSKNEPTEMNIFMKRIRVGQREILKNIFYETDSYTLENKSNVELNVLLNFMESNSHVKISISGHTDNVGSKEYNQTLSTNRAREVYNYLIKKGIDKNRLTYVGKNMSEPIASNDTEEGRAQNRRTEIEIVK